MRRGKRWGFPRHKKRKKDEVEVTSVYFTNKHTGARIPHPGRKPRGEKESRRKRKEATRLILLPRFPDGARN